MAILIQCWKKINTESYSATAGVGATRGIEASPQAVRCPSDHLVPSGSPASEVASWLWCLAGLSAERNTPQVSGSDQLTAYRTRRDDRHALTHVTSEPNMVSPLAHPNLKRVATVGNTVTSASVKDGPARWDLGPSLKGKTMETVKYIKIWHVSLTSMWYLLKVTLPQVELSNQGFFISLQSRVMALFFRHIPVIEDHGS